MGILESFELRDPLFIHYNAVGSVGSVGANSADDGIEKIICSHRNEFIIVNVDLSWHSKIFHLGEVSHICKISKFLFPRNDAERCHKLLMPYIFVKTVIDIIIEFANPITTSF